jgi:peptidoglycan/LPS O-acetylase OafA/YrhL
MYLLHFQALSLLEVALFNLFPLPRLPHTPLVFLAIAAMGTALTWLMALVLYRTVEKPLFRVRDRLRDSRISVARARA